jgi:hypothetical protein
MLVNRAEVVVDVADRAEVNRIAVVISLVTVELALNAAFSGFGTDRFDVMADTDAIELNSGIWVLKLDVMADTELKLAANAAAEPANPAVRVVIAEISAANLICAVNALVVVDCAEKLDASTICVLNAAVTAELPDNAETNLI